MGNWIIMVVRGYQKIFSPDKGILRGVYPIRGACRMYPTCSDYTILAIEKHGIPKGLLFGLIRVTKCHPFQKNLIDLP